MGKPKNTKKGQKVTKADKKAVDKSTNVRTTSPMAPHLQCRPSGVDKPGCRPSSGVDKPVCRPPGGDKYSCRPPGVDKAVALQGATNTCRPPGGDKQPVALQGSTNVAPQGSTSSQSGGAASNRPSLPVSIDLSISKAAIQGSVTSSTSASFQFKAQASSSTNHGCLLRRRGGSYLPLGGCSS
jgi:hypothetical protein